MDEAVIQVEARELLKWVDEALVKWWQIEEEHIYGIKNGMGPSWDNHQLMRRVRGLAWLAEREHKTVNINAHVVNVLSLYTDLLADEEQDFDEHIQTRETAMESPNAQKEIPLPRLPHV